MRGIGAGIVDNIMPAIGRSTSCDPQNTSRITSAANTIERTIMVMDTTTNGMTIMVMDTTMNGATIMDMTMSTITTTTISETMER